MTLRLQSIGRFLTPFAFTLLVGALVTSGGCSTNEPVGKTETTKKTVVDTPTEKTTVTEKHTKETKVIPD